MVKYKESERRAHLIGAVFEAMVFDMRTFSFVRRRLCESLEQEQDDGEGDLAAVCCGCCVRTAMPLVVEFAAVVWFGWWFAKDRGVSTRLSACRERSSVHVSNDEK